jgi:eukaryotic-like serine/threonine-protein kinase
MNRLGDASTDLLFGLIALHNDLITLAVIPAALRARALEPGRTLAELLVAQGALTPAQRDLVESLCGEYLNRHGGDAEKSLGILVATPSARERLDRLGDPEPSETLTPAASLASTVPRTEGRDFGCTTPPSQGGPRFRILRPHAKGGIGEVFVALDTELNREVALKRMQDRHANNPAGRCRFVLEAEVTGGLEHPGIVPIYGLGRDPDGRPFYAMRLIRGESLKQAIAAFHEAVGKPESDPTARSLELRQLLRRFVDVCNAVEYAHRRGVLHRDLKPGNIMVGPYGETLVVDWGLARASALATAGTSPAGAERPLRVLSAADGSSETLPGSVLGTPGYMSPEQAAGELDRLGPRSDVYSLGATLYCLLTGRPPFSELDPGDVLRAVRGGEFVPARQVDRAIDPALEAVCHKAMALNPEDRYPSPRALAEDVERWMADEPVTAHREPLAARARRGMRRHRTAVTAAVVAALVAVVGFAATAVVHARANVELRAANERETARFRLAMEAIESFHTGVTEDFLLKEDKFKDLRDKLLRKAADFYSRLEGLLKDQRDRSSRAALGRAYFELGRLTDQIGNKPDALAVHRKGLAIRRELAASSGGAVDAVADVARSLRQIASLREAMGDTSGAMESYDEGRRVGEGIAPSGKLPDDVAALVAAILFDIGWLQSQTGRPEQAWASYRACRASRQRLADTNPAANEFRRNLASVDVALGILLADTDRSAEALGSYARARAVLQALADANPGDVLIKQALASDLNELGLLLSQIGRSAEALEVYRQALAIWRGLGAAHPSVTDFQARVALVQSNIGVLHADAGRWSEALAAYRLALEVRRKLADANPSVSDFQNGVAFSLNAIGDTLDHLDRGAEAREALDRALAIAEGLVSANPGVIPYRETLAMTLGLTGRARWHEDRPAEAATMLRRAITIMGDIAKIQPNGIHDFMLANFWSLLSGIAATPGSGLSAAEARDAADQTMVALGRSIRSGRCNVRAILEDKDFDPLRSRPDFRMLVMDLIFPVNPFAP